MGVEHALTTAFTYRLDQGYPCLRLFKVQLQPSLMLVLRGKVWHDASVPGDAKAALMRELLEGRVDMGPGEEGG
jgi:hypothetical protein